MVFGGTHEDLRSLTLDLSGYLLDRRVVQDCLRLMQAYVLSPGYRHQSLFTVQTVERVRGDIGNACVFYVSTDFDLCEEFYSHDTDFFVAKQREVYRQLLNQRRRDCETKYIVLNKANREAQSRQGNGSSEVGSVTSSVVKHKKVPTKAVSVGSSSKNASEAGTSRKNSGKGGVANSRNDGGAFPSKRSKKDKKGDEEDPDVHHRVRELFGN